MAARRTKRIKNIADLTPDLRNANRGTERGVGMLDHSLRTFGAGRSVVVGKDGGVIAGNKTVERAAELDLPVRVVETDGNELVVVQRTDMASDSKAARELAIADNRCSEVGLDWDLEQLAADLEGGLGLKQFWVEGELEALLEDDGGGGTTEPPGACGSTVTCPACGEEFVPGRNE